MAMPQIGFSPALAQRNYQIVRRMFHDEVTAPRLRMPVPSAAEITAMEEAFGWVLWIPESRAVVRRVVYARSMVHPLNDRHVYSWRKLAERLNTDHKAVQRWFIAGVKEIFLIGASQTPQKAA